MMLEKMKNSLEKILNKKEIKIEKTKYIVEEEEEEEEEENKKKSLAKLKKPKPRDQDHIPLKKVSISSSKEKEKETFPLNLKKQKKEKKTEKKRKIQALSSNFSEEEKDEKKDKAEEEKNERKDKETEKKNKKLISSSSSKKDRTKENDINPKKQDQVSSSSSTEDNKEKPKTKTSQEEIFGKNQEFHKKSKQLNSSLEDSDNQTATVANGEKTDLNQKSLITISHIIDYDHFKQYNFSENFTISRQKKQENNIYLNDKRVSNEHAQIVFIERKKKMGFFLQDLGSINFIYLRVSEKSWIVLTPGIEILMGNTVFIFEKIEANEIEITAKINLILDVKENKKIFIKFSSSKINQVVYFGKKPNHEKPCIFNDDKEIEKEHVIFKKQQERILMKPLKSKTKTWIKIGNGKEKQSDFYLLRQNMEFKVAQTTFKIDQSYFIPWKCQKDFVNSVNVPCMHSNVCYNCAKETNVCKFCKVKGDVRALIYVYQSI